MKIKLLLGYALFSIAFAACQGAAPPSPNQILKPSAATSPAALSANSASVAPGASTSNTTTKIRTFDGKGVVTKINLELGSVALDHEEIKGFMAAMEGMEFYVSDKKMLANLKIGDRVDFVLEDNAGAERIISIRKK